MLKLMNLEVNRNSLKPYITAAFVITVIMIGFLYLFAVLPSLSGAEQDIEMFINYRSIATLACMLSMFSFTIFASVMNAKFIVEEYCSKKAILLFSYPINRKTIFKVKLATVLCFTFISMISSGLLSFGIFYITESISPICGDTLTLQTILNTLGLLLIYSIMACALALLSLWFGMWKKSIPVTIVSGTIIVIAICNLLGAGLNTPAMAIGVTPLVLIVGITVSAGISKKIDNMEV